MFKFLPHFIRSLIIVYALFFTVNIAHADEAALKIVTVNYPLKYFAEVIAGENASVTLPMPKDIDPAFWSPKTEDVVALQQADLILLNGADYAKWISKVSLPLFKLSNTSLEFKDAYIPLTEELKHNHGAGGEHSHAGTAFTTWLDFSLAAKQANAVLKVLSKKKPDLNQEFAKNFDSLQQSLLVLDEQTRKIAGAINGTPLIGSHPVYQYLKKAYNLNLKSVHWEPEDKPTEAQWEELKQILLTHKAEWMLWEGEPAAETVTKLQALGVKSIVYSPCGNVPESGDFLSVMQENTERLKTIIKK